MLPLFTYVCLPFFDWAFLLCPCLPRLHTPHVPTLLTSICASLSTNPVLLLIAVLILFLFSCCKHRPRMGKSPAFLFTLASRGPGKDPRWGSKLPANTPAGQLGQGRLPGKRRQFHSWKVLLLLLLLALLVLCSGTVKRLLLVLLLFLLLFPLLALRRAWLRLAVFLAQKHGRRPAHQPRAECCAAEGSAAAVAASESWHTSMLTT
mmetsp:Transcript_68496/g.149619  ORF Transcript_68496/g.149619 Transcript_68496/m.149619 type:complete len:206 (-) Transcript_68496:1024-1641(-)